MATQKKSTPVGAPLESYIEDTIYASLASILSRTDKEHPITREELSAMVVGKNKAARDRSIRNYIHNMRAKGAPICSSSDGKGYWMARTRAELLEFIQEYTHYAAEIYRTAAAMEQAMELDGQVEMKEAN